MLDKELGDMRNRMTKAAELDSIARQNGQPATNKLRMLPEVINLLNRNNLRNQIVDPDINLLEAVRFFLEPLADGSLPAYNIQRELFQILAKLPMTKDTVVASGIGKVILFYTRSKKAEPKIKLQAERLARDWMRLILKRPDDYR
jgi:transcription factor SPN1